jgi:hypothetical protein
MATSDPSEDLRQQRANTWKSFDEKLLEWSKIKTI